MAAELQPPDHPITTNTATTTTTTTTANAPATAIVPAQPDNAAGPPLAPKRQRRPSVRLGEIGDPPASHDSHVRRTNNNSNHPWYPHSKSIKARSLTNLVNGDNNNNNVLDFGHHHRRIKSKRAPTTTTKRVRSNWVSRIDEEGAKSDSREDGDELGFRDFDLDSDSLLKEQQSPVDNAAIDLWHHRRLGSGRARVSDNDAIEMDHLPDSDSRDRKYEGVRTWLIELGLSRYAPVFEIHEVDDEVLPMLTLEDLKDMGINAVGSRRKLYTAIQKLRKGFS